MSRRTPFLVGRVKSSWDLPLCAHRPQARAALLCTSFTQDTCLRKVQPPAPGRLPLEGLPGGPVSPWGLLQGVKPAYIQSQHFETSPGRGEITLQEASSSCWGWSPSRCRCPLPTSMCHFQALTSSPSETSAPAGMAGPPPLLGAPGAAAWVPAAGGRVSWPGEALGRS